MKALWRDFVLDEAGVILSAELVIILTIAVLGMIVGLANLQQGILSEFNDLTMAFQSLNQSYGTPSYRGCWKWFGRTSWFAGSSFFDIYDGCIGSNLGMGYAGGDIIGGGVYNLPSQGGTVVDEVMVPSAACPTGVPTQTTPSTAMPLPVPSQAPASGSCPTCP